MTKLVISFDTEDYVNPKGADGILDTAQMLRAHGYKGCYNVVGWLAEALVKWGRQDVIDELKHHEIESHSLRHSYHPTINEYTDLADFDEAMALFREKEDKALEIIKGILGNDAFYAACPPGDSVSYVAHYGYADMGIPIYDGDFIFDANKGRPVSYCNIKCLEYNKSFDIFSEPFCDESFILDLIEDMAKYEVYIFYHHPQKHIVTTFTDIQNFYGENIPGEYILSDLLSDEEVERFRKNFNFFLDTIKKDPRFEVVGYKEIAQAYQNDNRVVTPDMIPELKRALDEDLFPVTTPDSFSLADIMLACRDFLNGKAEHKCEKVYGFLETPYAISHPVKLTKDELREMSASIVDGKFLPTSLSANNKTIGPADWLRAALDVLSGKSDTVAVPDKWQINLNQFPKLRDCQLKGSWVHAKSFEDKYISNRLRLQTWTISLPKNTNRFIF